QGIQPGDEILVNSKSTGTLVADNLLPGKHLYLLSTGTGLAPFLSIIKDPEIYDLYDKVIVTHGVRQVKDLAYRDFIEKELREDEFLGDLVRDKLVYYPTVTREPYRNQGRLTELLVSGKLAADVGLPQINTENDRFMLCGSPSMLKETCRILNDFGFQEVRH